MTDSSNQSGVTSEVPSPRRQAIPWPVRALALLLLVQTAVNLGLGIYNHSAFPLTVQMSAAPTLSAAVFLLISFVTTSFSYYLVALLAFLACLGFARLWQPAWLLAVSVQGLALLFALINYFGPRPLYVYALMASAIFMVVYLHHPDVQTAFAEHPPDAAEEVAA